jgi:hypothetical protein
VSIRTDGDGCILLEGHCTIDDVEPLLRGLLESPTAVLDWRNCHWAHAAVVQLMLVSGRSVLGPPDNPFLAARIDPVFRQPSD